MPVWTGRRLESGGCVTAWGSLPLGSATQNKKKTQRDKHMERFLANFGNVIKSIDANATTSVEGECIVVTTDQPDIMTLTLPEEFEEYPIVVVDLSSEA